MFTQILLDHGFGAAGVAINSAPTEGVAVVPLSQIKSTFPVLKNPANRHKAVGFTFEQWQYAFTNTFSEEKSRALYERYHIPASGRIFWGSALANIHPGHDDNHVDYKNDDRAPLLFISGSDDHLMPPKVQRSNAKHYKSEHGDRGQGVRRAAPAPRAGRLGGDRRLRLDLGRRACPIVGRAARDADQRMTNVRITHIGGPTVLLEIGDWRLLTDPTFDAPGRRYSFGWGTSSRKLAGPAIAAADLPPIDAVLLSHDHHGDNLDPAGRALLPSAGAVVTTVSGAKRLGGGARGLEPWATTRLEAPARPPIEITATPCRHGPPLSRPIVGDAIGFALRWDGQEHGVLWISGDTVLYDGVRQVADRLRVDTAHPAPGRRAVPGHRAVALHDDRAGRRRAVPPDQPAHRDPRPLRGLEALPGGPRGDRARVRTGAPGHPRAHPLAAHRRRGRCRRVTSSRSAAAYLPP